MIITTAAHTIVDRFRRESVRGERHAQAALLHPAADDEQPEEGHVHDDRLRLIFTCCHPALALDARVALTLRLLGGLSTKEIARAFLISETTVAQRLVRAKRKFRDARIPYRVPHDSDLPERVHGVLAVVYLIFNEGHTASSGDDLVRTDLTGEGGSARPAAGRADAGRARSVGAARADAADRCATPGTHGCRRESGSAGRQDRRRWDRGLIAEGQALVRRCLPP